MPAKAGKFQLIPGDTTVPPSNSGFSVEVGFQPDLVIVMTTGLTSEDTWSTGTDIWGGMMAICRGDQAPTGLSEWWNTTPLPHSFWSNSGVVWFRPGPAVYLSQIHSNGFYMGYPGGYEGQYGAFCYYLALSGDVNTQRVFGYQGSPAVTLGWEPSLIFSLASGGFDASPGDIAMADTSVPSFGFGGYENLANPLENGVQWLANGLTHFTSVEQFRFMTDGSGTQTVFDPFTAAQIIASAEFSFARTSTSADINWNPFFPAADSIRTGAHLMEGGVFSGGSVTPNPIGTPLEVDTAFSPDAVMFILPQDGFVPGFGAVPWGGRGFGFLTDDFECCMVWGAYSHIGPSASFCTSNYSWISNFTSTALSDPARSNPNYGTAELGGPGFIMHTQAMPKFNNKRTVCSIRC